MKDSNIPTLILVSFESKYDYMVKKYICGGLTNVPWLDNGLANGCIEDCLFTL